MASRLSATGTPVRERLADVDATGAPGTNNYLGSSITEDSHLFTSISLRRVMNSQSNLDEAAFLFGTPAGTTLDRAHQGNSTFEIG